MSILKSHEEKARLQALKEKEKAERIIASIEAKAHAREAKKNRILEDYNKRLADYNMKCQVLGADLRPSQRMLLMISHVKWDQFPFNEWQRIISDYRLTEVFAELDKIGQPGEKAPAAPVIDEADLE